jgi:hypothetical protein
VEQSACMKSQIILRIGARNFWVPRWSKTIHEAMRIISEIAPCNTEKLEIEIIEIEIIDFDWNHRLTLSWSTIRIYHDQKLFGDCGTYSSLKPLHQFKQLVNVNWRFICRLRFFPDKKKSISTQN